MNKITLLSAQTSAGNGASMPFARATCAATFFAWGTFGGSTVKMQASPVDGTTWIDVPSASLTAAGTVVLNPLFAAPRVRAVVVGGAGMNVNAALFR
jgi:hypothetical protein